MSLRSDARRRRGAAAAAEACCGALAVAIGGRQPAAPSATDRRRSASLRRPRTAERRRTAGAAVARRTGRRRPAPRACRSSARRLRLDRGDGRLVELVGCDHARLRFLLRYSSMQTRERCGQVCRSQSAEATLSPAGAEPVVSGSGFGAALVSTVRALRGRRRRQTAVSASPAVERLRTRPAKRRPWPQSSTAIDRMVPHRVTQKRKSARRRHVPPPSLSSSGPARSRSGMQRRHASGVPMERAHSESVSAETNLRRGTSRRAARPRSPAPSCRTCWDAASAGSR